MFLYCIFTALLECMKPSKVDKEIQTDGKFITFEDEKEFKCFVSNIEKASAWISPREDDNSNNTTSHIFIAKND